MYNLYLCIQLIYIFMVCQSAEMADSKVDSEDQAKPSVISSHYNYVQDIPNPNPNPKTGKEKMHIVVKLCYCAFLL